MNVFFDSSAWVKRYIDEKGSEQVEEIGQEAEHVTLSILGIPEVISAFGRLYREGKISQKKFKKLQGALYSDIEDVQLINITMEVISTTVQLIRQYPLRTLDALHIACAKAGEADLLITADQRQAKAAEGIGLKTLLV